MDALATLINLLKPQAVGAKLIHGAGPWGVRYPAFRQPGFALVIQGSCRLSPDKMRTVILKTGDFVLFPSTPGFTLARDSKTKAAPAKPDVSGQSVEEVFHGDKSLPPSTSLLGGYFSFDPVNAPILLNLLPKILHIRADDPSCGDMASLVSLVQHEAREQRPGRALVLGRLVEILLLKSLRSTKAIGETPGLLAGLRDPQLATALQRIHTQASHPWTLLSLAREAGMSRSSFADRFARVVGTAPMQYLLEWRLAVAKDLLVHGYQNIEEIAFAIGYESGSGFSTAFRRETGMSPKQFREWNQQTVST